MTGDRDQDRFVKVIRGRGGNLPRISTVVLQFRATQKGPATGCAARRVSELRRRQGVHDRRRPSCFSCVVEPGGLATELGSHNKPEVRNEMIDPFYEETEVLAPRTSPTASPTWSPGPAIPPSASCGSCPPTRCSRDPVLARRPAVRAAEGRSPAAALWLCRPCELGNRARCALQIMLAASICSRG
jgi:hypothetical protein